MYQNAAILAAVILVYSAVAGRVGQSWLSGPILCTAAGLILGPAGMGMLRLSLTAADLRVIAEFALAMVLFTDAARADLGVARRTVGLPERLLLLGLPFTIVLGYLFARVLFPESGPLEAALIAALLAPTDAALGAPVVINKAVPAATREALNIESGLNDGICVPVVIVLLDFAVGHDIERSTLGHIVIVATEEIGIGLLVGLGLTGIGAWFLRLANRVGWTATHWRQVPVIALAVLCFTAAQAAGGSGFIACFTGGLLFGYLAPDDDVLAGAASTGEVLALLTWVAFGGPVLARLLPQFTWRTVLYAVLSLTVIRMVPVFLSLIGSGLGTRDRLFIGWFGPRGLASIVFAIITFNAGLPGKETIAVTAACTVLLSVVLHGLTANPLVRVLGMGGVTHSATASDRAT